jgi:hypothetical protein
LNNTITSGTRIGTLVVVVAAVVAIVITREESELLAFRECSQSFFRKTFPSVARRGRQEDDEELLSLSFHDCNP